MAEVQVTMALAGLEGILADTRAGEKRGTAGAAGERSYER